MVEQHWSRLNKSCAGALADDPSAGSPSSSDLTLDLITPVAADLITPEAALLNFRAPKDVLFGKFDGQFGNGAQIHGGRLATGTEQVQQLRGPAS